MVVIGLLLPLPPAGHAQAQNTPHIGYIYPAGGRQGTTFQVKLGGQFLDGVTNAYVSGSGVRASVIEFTKPLTPLQANKLREQLKELQDKRQAANRPAARRNGEAEAATNVTFTAEDQRMLFEIRRKLMNFQRRPPNPAIADNVVLRITLAPDAEPGQHELRLSATAGLSNPLVFCVGQLPEVRKKEPGNAEEPPFRRPLRNNNEPTAAAPTETSVTLPVVVNGQILPGGVDRFRFRAHQGQRLVAMVSARELIPYLADAVPGWFQATLALRDTKGNEVAYDDRYRFHPDPVIACEIPHDGEYVLEIKDSIYRGREDFVYRIAIGELPFVTSAFPLGGKAGTTASIELSGWNLPATNVEAGLQSAGDVPTESGTKDNPLVPNWMSASTSLVMVASCNPKPGIYPISLSGNARTANCVPFAVDTLPECLEKEPNDSIGVAQPVTLPIILNGRISQPGDWDVFRFEGQAGDQFVGEVYARRLDSPLDSVLKLTDAEGRQLAFNDDHEDKASGLNTHHADSYLNFTLPTNGTYYLHLGDAQHQGGPEYAYRLRLSQPRPDFELRVVPSSINARPGVSVPLTVYALRKDGFTNDITLTLIDPPPGFTLGGAKVPPNQDHVRVTLLAAGPVGSEPVNLSMQGAAIIQGRPVIHPVVPADDLMQAFAYHHLVPARELKVALVGNARFPGRTFVRILDSTPIKIPAGGTARVRIGTPSSAFVDRWELELNEPPDGIAIKNVSPFDEGAEIVLRCDAAKVKPGQAGNLIVNVLPGKNLVPAAQNAKKQNNPRRFAVGFLPAIPFEIVESP